MTIRSPSVAGGIPNRCPATHMRLERHASLIIAPWDRRDSAERFYPHRTSARLGNAASSPWMRTHNSGRFAGRLRLLRSVRPHSANSSCP
jgi:hypothetical protein